jgi:oxygen-dependent protoporphyrinogen oxidase
VLAGPAADTASLVGGFDSTLGSVVRSIATAPLVVVCLGYDEAEVAADRGPLNGFGFLVPRSEGVRMLGALWETSIYPERAPAGKALVRVMIGGAHDPGAVSLDDDDLLRVVRAELAATMGLRAAPEFVRIIRHARGIPQYTLGHVARLQRIDALLRAHPGLFLAGNSYRGVAINSCIAEAGSIADGVLASLGAAKAAEATASA